MTTGRMGSVFRSIGWTLAVVGIAIVLLVTSLTYLSFEPARFPELFRESFEARLGWLYLHIIGSMVALATGPVQFYLRRLKSPARRARYLPLHRSLGRIYVAGALTGGVGGFYLAFFAQGGLPAALGFAALAVLLLGTTALAYVRARQRDGRSHRAWMARSFALLFAAVTLRLYMGIADGIFGVPFDTIYPILAWLCWVPNLIAVELLVRRAWPSVSQPLVRSVPETGGA